MAGSLFSMANLARIAKVVALLLFVLPWVTISCAEQPLVTMSGVDLATGHVMMHNPMTGATETPAGRERRRHLGDPRRALLILAGLAASFLLKGRNGLIANMAGAGLAAAALAYTVLVRIPHAAHAGRSRCRRRPCTGGGPSPEQIAQMIQVKVQIGFWLTLLALIAAIVFDLLAMKAGGGSRRRAARRRRRRGAIRPSIASALARAAGSSTSSQRSAADVDRRRLAPVGEPLDAFGQAAARPPPPPDRLGERRRGAEQAGVDRVEAARASCRSARSRRPRRVATLVASSMSSSGLARSRSTASVSAAAGARDQQRGRSRDRTDGPTSSADSRRRSRRRRRAPNGRWAGPNPRRARCGSEGRALRQVGEERLDPLRLMPGHDGERAAPRPRRRRGSTCSISGMPATGVSGLEGEIARSRLPWPAAMIRQFIRRPALRRR